MLAPARRPQRVRLHAGPGRRQLPVRPDRGQVPAGRRYLPGTLVLETTWRARGGWVVVRDAMCIGPWYHQQRRSGTHRRPPTDYEAEHILLRTVKCIIGNVELSLDCEPVFDYGRTEATWEYSGQGYGEAIAHGGEGDVQLRLVTDLRVGFEGRGAPHHPGRATGPSPPCAGRARSGRPRRSTGPSGPRRPPPTRPSSGWSGRPSTGGAGSTRACSPSTLAVLPAAQRPHPQGPDLRPDRGAAGRGHHLAARDPRRRAQLRLPLHLDPRRHLHALGPVHPRVRARGQRLLLLRGRRLPGGGQPPDHVRGRGRGAARAGAGPPERLRGLPAGPDRQRGRHPEPARRLGPCSTRSTSTPSPGTTCPSGWPLLKRAVETAIANWSKPDQGIWEVRGRRGTSPPPS